MLEKVSSKRAASFVSTARVSCSPARWTENVSHWAIPSRGFALGPFAPLLGTTLVYAEKVGSQFLSLRQLGRSAAFSTETCRQLSPVTATISHVRSGLQTGRAGSLFSERSISLR